MNKKLLASGITLSMLLCQSTVANAEDGNEQEPTTEQQDNQSNEDGQKDTELKDKIFVEGGDLNQQQIEDTKKELDVDDGYKTHKITTEDVQQFLGTQYDTIYSSASITPKKFGKGVEVTIKTPDTITKVTEQQYTNAAITAGIENAKIEISSVNEVTGDGALTGIYKAYADEGMALDQNDVQNANDEMSKLSQIKDEQEQNGGKGGYSDEAMNNAIADIKEQIANKKADNQEVSDDDIRKIVDLTLKSKGLDKVLSDSQIEIVNNIAINAAHSKALNKDPKSYAKQSEKLKDSLKGSASSFKDKVEDNKGFFASLWQKIVDIWNAIIGFFASLKFW